LDRIPGLPDDSMVYIALSVGATSHHFLVHHSDHGWAAVAWLWFDGEQRTCYLLNAEQAELQANGITEDWRQASWWPDLPSLFTRAPAWAHHHTPVFAAALDLLAALDPPSCAEQDVRLRTNKPDTAAAVARYRQLGPVPLEDPSVETIGYAF
jgi:hypothetical protein